MFLDTLCDYGFLVLVNNSDKSTSNSTKNNNTSSNTNNSSSKSNVNNNSKSKKSNNSSSNSNNKLKYGSDSSSLSILYKFDSNLTRHTIYDLIVPSKRKTMHLKLAQKMEQLFNDDLDNTFPTLAYHYQVKVTLKKHITNFFYLLNSKYISTM